MMHGEAERERGLFDTGKMEEDEEDGVFEGRTGEELVMSLLLVLTFPPCSSRGQISSSNSSKSTLHVD